MDPVTHHHFDAVVCGSELAPQACSALLARAGLRVCLVSTPPFGAHGHGTASGDFLLGCTHTPQFRLLCEQLGISHGKYRLDATTHDPPWAPHAVLATPQQRILLPLEPDLLAKELQRLGTPAAQAFLQFHARAVTADPTAPSQSVESLGHPYNPLINATVAWSCSNAHPSIEGVENAYLRWIQSTQNNTLLEAQFRRTIVETIEKHGGSHNPEKHAIEVHRKSSGHWQLTLNNDQPVTCDNLVVGCTPQEIPWKNDHAHSSVNTPSMDPVPVRYCIRKFSPLTSESNPHSVLPPGVQQPTVFVPDAAQPVLLGTHRNPRDILHLNGQAWLDEPNFHRAGIQRQIQHIDQTIRFLYPNLFQSWNQAATVEVRAVQFRYSNSRQDPKTNPWQRLVSTANQWMAQRDTRFGTLNYCGHHLFPEQGSQGQLQAALDVFQHITGEQVIRD